VSRRLAAEKQSHLSVYALLHTRHSQMKSSMHRNMALLLTNCYRPASAHHQSETGVSISLLFFFSIAGHSRSSKMSRLDRAHYYDFPLPLHITINVRNFHRSLQLYGLRMTPLKQHILLIPFFNRKRW